MPASSLEFLGVEFDACGRTRVSPVARARFLYRLKERVDALEFHPAKLEKTLEDRCRGYMNYYRHADDYDDHAGSLMKELRDMVEEGGMYPGVRWIGTIHLMNRARR